MIETRPCYNQVHPVYSNFVHNAVCIDAVGGIAAIFSTMLSISVLSMMMLALRAALYPIQQSHLTVAANDRVSSQPPESNSIEPACSAGPDKELQGLSQTFK
mmetsp:Transcript_6710/g.11960  ORF Transcript_6710/g.11960 Transcript_6710/m.11960 type:complete len:102 (+) Transcript_6710:789-1094(+)